MIHFDVGRGNAMSKDYVFPVVITCRRALSAKFSVCAIKTNRTHYFTINLYR